MHANSPSRLHHLLARMTRDPPAFSIAWLSRLTLSVGFVAAYVALDLLSFMHPQYGLNITLWNPAPALGLVFAARIGRAAWLPLAAAVVLAELAAAGPATPLWVTAVPGLVLALGYGLLGRTLALRLPRDSLLDDRRTLVAWLLRAMIGSLLISLAYVIALRLVGLLPAADVWNGLKHFWTGDGVGIVVTMPLLWCVSSRRGRKRLRRRVFNLEGASYLMLGAVTLWLAFGAGDDSGFKRFYLLFLPIVWAASRHGMGGAMVCAVALQVGVIVAVRLLQYSAVGIAELQTLATAMGVTGFFIGAVVSELRNTTQELRHSLRLAAAGEMAGALTHEIQHPLTTLTAYAHTCEHLLERGETGEPLRTAVRCVIRETGKTRELLRRLQEFFRTGTPNPELVSLAELVDAAVAPYLIDAEHAGVRLRVAPMPEAQLMVDRLQLEVVLRSLLANSLESVAESPRRPQRISLAGWKDDNGHVYLRIEDSGSGLSYEQVTRLFDPLETARAGGRGLALTISRAIVVAHRGRLWAEVANHGVFKIELPLAVPDGGTGAEAPLKAREPRTTRPRAGLVR